MDRRTAKQIRLSLSKSNPRAHLILQGARVARIKEKVLKWVLRVYYILFALSYIMIFVADAKGWEWRLHFDHYKQRSLADHLIFNSGLLTLIAGPWVFGVLVLHNLLPKRSSDYKKLLTTGTCHEYGNLFDGRYRVVLQSATEGIVPENERQKIADAYGFPFLGPVVQRLLRELQNQGC